MGKIDLVGRSLPHGDKLAVPHILETGTALRLVEGDILTDAELLLLKAGQRLVIGSLGRWQ